MNQNEISPLDRYLGCLFGLAVGDALGTTLEFKSPGSFTPIDDIVGGGPFNLEPGQWTDDTSMALCLAESLIEKSGFDPRDQCERYVRWMQDGHLSSNGRCFDIGNTVSRALRDFARTGDPASGPDGDHDAGNGSIMRLAPVPMFFGSDAEQAIHLSGESSRTTHGTRACIDACRYMAGILVALLQGASKDDVLTTRFHPTCGTWPAGELCPDIERVANGSFRDGALLAVNLGDDADTTGAIYGQFAGACYSFESIPENWREKITDADLIRDFARQLHDHSNPTGS